MTRSSVSATSDKAPPDAFGIVDTHCHLWHLELARRTGLTPDFAPLFRTFSPNNLSVVTSPSGVSACVLIESGKTQEENQQMEKMAASSNLIAAFLPFVDLASPTLEQDLDGWRENPKFRGVRARFEGHPDPDILMRPAVIRGIARLAERSLVLEFLVRASHLKHILSIYERIPRLKAIIEHMAKPDFVGARDRAEWRSLMKALAVNTPVACKLSLSPRVEELPELLKAPGQGWPAEMIKPFVASLVEWFGPARLMWGSDWPVALLVADYQDTLRAMRTALGKLQPQDEEKLFRNSGVEFYQLENAVDTEAHSRGHKVASR